MAENEEKVKIYENEIEDLKSDGQYKKLEDEYIKIQAEVIALREVQLKYEMPLAEVITDFFDAMKSRSKGYASMELSYLVLSYPKAMPP